MQSRVPSFVERTIRLRSLGPAGWSSRGEERTLNNCPCVPVATGKRASLRGGSVGLCPPDSHRDRERPTPPSGELRGKDRRCKACRCINASLHLHEAATIRPPTSPRDTHLSFPENLWSPLSESHLLRLTAYLSGTVLGFPFWQPMHDSASS